MLSILLKSYWNGIGAGLIGSRGSTFNSSKVLLEQAKSFWVEWTKDTFNSSKVLLERFKGMARDNQWRAFNSSKVLLEQFSI